MATLRLFSLLLVLGFTQALYKAECDLVPADFVFLLDSSGSETTKGFKTQLAFISNFTSNFEVGADKAQFAAVTFSTGVHKNFYLNEHATQASVLDAINKIQYSDGETYTDLGLNFVRNNVLQANHGARPNVAKYVIVLTDGRSNDNSKTVQAAMALHNVPNVTVIAIGIGHAIDVNELHIIATDRNHSFVVNNFDLLHNMGVEVFVIGMGHSVDFRELQQIATDRDHVYRISSTNDLAAIHTNIVDAICKLKVPPPTTTPMPTTTTTLPTTTVKQACGQKPADIVFLLDASESEQAEGFGKEIQFVYNFARKFHIGPQNVQFSSVTFSSNVRNDFFLNTYSNRHDVLNAIQKISYMQGGTNTSFGLKFVRDNSFKPQNGARTNATKIVIVITDGQSADSAATKHEAQLLHHQGVLVYAVGVGSDVDSSELKAISSNGTPILVTDFSLLHDIQASLETAACHGGT
uniref:VWFA domain-containing protein n=1 Tax=Magallana gigas TaxID=29159 RepID=A0A8W8NWN6_MAGGI